MQMTDVKRERIAKHLLSLFQDIWCDRESDEKPNFNCKKCEFADYGWCKVKIFINTTKYEEECPQGAIKGGDDE